MSTLASFHWGWLLAAAVLGLIIGWVSVARRSEGLSLLTMRWALAAVSALGVIAVARLLPGRLGYWLDLGLLLGLCYVGGCVVGAWLRERVVARAAARASSGGL